MGTAVLAPLWNLLSGAFGFKAGVFHRVSELPNGLILALLIVLASGLSLAIGQSIVLFINRVKPLRFVFSLLISAVLRAFGYLFLVFSTWLFCQMPWSVHVPFVTLAKVLGLSYVPLLFSFLGALPYLGFPVLRVLSIWHLLLMVFGFATVANIDLSLAFGYVAFGWLVQELLENTIGEPIARLGKKLADWVAGVNLRADQRGLAQIIESGLSRVASPMVTVSATGSSLPEVRQFVRATGRSAPEAAQAVAQAVATQPIAAPNVRVIQSIDTTDPMLHLERHTSGISGAIKVLLSLLGMAILFVLVALVLKPLKIYWFAWYRDLPYLFRLIFNLVWIGIVAIVFAGLLAPLETLGWWAGWYGDRVDTHVLAHSNQPVANLPSVKAPSRYVIYLDGIGQSGEEYTPDVEDFLTALQAALPKDMELVRGLMMYSVLNKPLDEDRPLAFLWRMADKMRWKNPAALLGIMVNLRNVLIVAVSADKRYGPIYNQGIAQVLYDGLRQRGYEPGSGVPVTLIGYSGGGEMSVAAAPYLKEAIDAPIDVISLGGVMSANNNFLKLEHLYQLVGEKDSVERIGPIMFPGRWKVFPLSYWNRAKRKGKISIISLGAMGHQVPGGMMDPQAFLADGRSNLQHTVETIVQILNGQLLDVRQTLPRKESNYALFKQVPFTDPAYYPIGQTVDLNWYRPIGDWMGRLILPEWEDRQKVKGVWFEVHHTAPGYESLVGKVVKLRWSRDPVVQKQVKAVTRDVHFSAEAAYTSEYGGLIHPDRLNHWRQVDPLESLAGSHPEDDITVMLDGAIEVVEPDGQANYHADDQNEDQNIILYTRNTPVQITGHYYSLVQFQAPIEGTDRFRVVHFNPASRQFDGLAEVVALPPVELAAAYGSYPSTTQDLERSPLNETGWYIYGAKDASGTFVVQSYGPRSLFRLQPDRVIFGEKQAYRYIRKEAWANAAAQKGHISSVLCSCRENESSASIQAAIQEWQEGDRALVVHTYGGIGGNKREPAAASPIFFGHFAYGLAKVIHEPLADELRFEIQYQQVYTHNTDGLIAGTLHWSRYMGDRQFGWLGTRPTCDIVIKQPAFTGDFDTKNKKQSALSLMMMHLQVMTARYRIGDGTGGTYVGPANNCSQDSNQALFASIRSLEQSIEANAASIEAWLAQGSADSRRFHQLIHLGRDLKLQLQLFGALRSDWEHNEFNLGCTLEDLPIRNLVMGLGSWRTLLPRKASDVIVKIFLDYGASVWVLRTNQIGGYDPDIEPIAPITL